MNIWSEIIIGDVITARWKNTAVASNLLESKMRILSSFIVTGLYHCQKNKMSGSINRPILVDIRLYLQDKISNNRQGGGAGNSEY